MTVSIDPSSIQLTVNALAAKPRVKLFNVPFNLGGQPFNDAAQFDLGAIAADGSVRFSIGPGDTLDGWKVGFIQIVRINSLMTIYAGRTSGEGSIICDTLSELVPNNVMLDTRNIATAPWAVPPVDKKAFKGLVATPTMADNPNLHVPQRLGNLKASNLPNFLLRFQWDTDFWTILTAIGPDQSRHYLAHFHWRVAHDVGCFWLRGVPHPREQAASPFKLIDNFVAGPPKDAALQPVLTNPSGSPNANDLANKAHDKSLVGNDIKSHLELDTWFFSVPELRIFGVPAVFWT